MRTGLTKLMAAFHSFVNALKNHTFYVVYLCFNPLRSPDSTLTFTIAGARVGVVVKALCYKPAGRGFDPRWCDWNSSVT
jgi:hypothetical protein